MTGSQIAVLDASAVLAVILRERRAHHLTPKVLQNAVGVSTVNLAEVQSKLVRAGYDAEDAWKDAVSIASAIEPYTAEQAKIAGTLIAQTEDQGLSLGDRSCLALAIMLNGTVYTTDQIWQSVQVGVRIHVIR